MKIRKFNMTKRSKHRTVSTVVGAVFALIFATMLPINNSRVWAKEEPTAIQDSYEDKILREYYGKEILPAYGMADLSTKTKVFGYDSEREIRWTGTIGIASAELCDLDRDGRDELFLAVLEEETTKFCVYEVENGAVVKKAEIFPGRWSDMVAYDEILTLIHTEQGSYLLYTQSASGILEDFYDADIRLYRYDGGKLYVDMMIFQMEPGSDVDEYAVWHNNNQGEIMSEEIISGTDQDGEYLDDEHQSKRIKELFAEYGIVTCEQPSMWSSFEDLVSADTDHKVLMKLGIWHSGYSMGKELYHFNETQFLLPGSNSVYLTKEDLEGLSQGELRLARNEIYARHGLIFQDKALTDYFTAKGYYRPFKKAVPDTELNQYEIANLKLIVSMENRNN